MDGEFFITFQNAYLISRFSLKVCRKLPQDSTLVTSEKEININEKT